MYGTSQPAEGFAQPCFEIKQNTKHFSSILFFRHYPANKHFLSCWETYGGMSFAALGAFCRQEDLKWLTPWTGIKDHLVLSHLTSSNINVEQT